MTTPGSGARPGVVHGEIRPTHRRYASGLPGTKTQAVPLCVMQRETACNHVPARTRGV